MEQLKAAGQGLKAAAAGVAPGAGGSGGLGAWRPPRGAEVYHDEAEDLSFIEPVCVQGQGRAQAAAPLRAARSRLDPRVTSAAACCTTLQCTS